MKVRFDPPVKSIADLLRRLGDVPPDRVRLDPAPGTATRRHLLKRGNESCELVDRTLVEKAMGAEEAFLAAWVITLLNQFARHRNLGVVYGPDARLDLPGDQVRGPDVSFISWDRMENRRRSSDPVPKVVPDLVVEVLSAGNTKAEMARKRDEYFRSGVLLVWEIDPRKRTVRAYTAPDRFTDLVVGDVLTADPALPGFSLPLADLFGELDRHG